MDKLGTLVKCFHPHLPYKEVELPRHEAERKGYIIISKPKRKKESKE